MMMAKNQKKPRKLTRKLDTFSFGVVLSPLFSAFLPFVLWPIEQYVQFPVLIEELAKVVLVYLVRDVSSRRTKLILALLMGVTFTLSETVLYSFNISQQGSLNFPLLRLVATGIMHTLTFVILMASTFKNTRYLPIGVVVAILVHSLYNRAVVSINF